MWISRKRLEALEDSVKELKARKRVKLWFGFQMSPSWYPKNHPFEWSESINEKGIDPQDLLCQIANDLGYTREGKVSARIVKKVAKKKARVNRKAG